MKSLVSLSALLVLIADAFYPASHHANELDRILKLVKIQTWHVEKFAGFVANMAARLDGDGRD